MLIAVPLSLWRKPSTKASGAASSASASASGELGGAPRPPLVPAASASAPARLSLGPVQKVRCGASAASAPNEGTLCESLPAFEEALKQAVLSGEGCAPKSKLKGSINYVLTIDFTRKKLHIFPGASGDWKGKQARRATSCVENALKAPDWNVPHQYRFYAIAVLATYAGTTPESLLPSPSAAAPPGGPKLPTFE